MAAVRTSVEAGLKRIVGEDRVRTDDRERAMYSFDIGAMPGLVKPFVGAGTAGAVVRPKTEADIIGLVGLARDRSVKLVPRAWATSGYGGVLPPEGAVVVDVSGMQRVLKVDADAMTVRAQAGAIWEQVDREIKKQGLTLRLYPSSYPSSSVGGWLAQGGSGFGSLEFGQFKKNVVSARVVLPTGDVKEFAGDELTTYVADAEGITGIIVEVEFKVRRLEEEVHRLVAFKDVYKLGAALQAVSSRNIRQRSMRERLHLPLPSRHPQLETQNRLCTNAILRASSVRLELSSSYCMPPLPLPAGGPRDLIAILQQARIAPGVVLPLAAGGHIDFYLR